MEISFIIYLLCILLILGLVFLIIKRNFIVAEYQEEHLTDGKKPLKYIPKKLFQLIADKNNIDPAFQKNIEYNKKMNPDWAYYLLDDKDMIAYSQAYYPPEILFYYNKINPKYGAARADFFRYLLMYREGGVYLDIKSAAKFPLSRIIKPDEEYILSHWGHSNPHKNILKNELGEYQQWHIICRPKHPFLRAVINRVIENIENYDVDRDGVGKPSVLKVTGPVAYSQAIIPIIDKYRCRIVEIDDMLGLVYNNIAQSHTGLFSATHYSQVTEPVINF